MEKVLKNQSAIKAAQSGKYEMANRQPNAALPFCCVWNAQWLTIIKALVFVLKNKFEGEEAN